MGDKDMDEYRRVLSAIVLPEMVFHLNRVELVHEASGTTIVFNALDALTGWKLEDLPPLQVRVAEEWRKAREHEIQQQKAVQLTYDWTYTTPYTCTVISGGDGPASGSTLPAIPQGAAVPEPVDVAIRNSNHLERRGLPDYVRSTSSLGSSNGASASSAVVLPTAATAPPLSSNDTCSPVAHPVLPPGTAVQTPFTDGGSGAGGRGSGSALPVGAASSPAQVPVVTGNVWQPTTDQIDRGLLMERDPILFYDELPLYESDLDDNGVCALTVKLRVMPRCWLVLLRLWVRVDSSMVRLRETRLFCRHDKPDKRLEVLQEVKHCEGTFAELRSRGAPDEGPAYADADLASQVFQAVAPVGLKLLQTRKLVIPSGPGSQAPHPPPPLPAEATTMAPPPLPPPATLASS